VLQGQRLRNLLQGQVRRVQKLQQVTHSAKSTGAAIRKGAALFLSLRQGLQRQNRKGKSKPELAIDFDLNRVNALAGELDSTEDMNIRGMGIESGEMKLNLACRDGFLVFGIQDGGMLDELADATTPSRPKTKLEKTEWDRRGGNHTDDANERLLAARLLPHILAQDAGLQIGQNHFGHVAKLNQLWVKGSYRLDIKAKEATPPPPTRRQCDTNRKFPARGISGSQPSI
jgi:hypothetical protein